MHTHDLSSYQHSHTFDQDRIRAGETRTRWVILITGVMMLLEIGAGVAYGSMALLADGLHMASHASALLIVAFAYAYARRRAKDARFAFGTGKVNSLAGFTGAILLALFALMMAIESAMRFFEPVAVAFDQAILVAVVGLLVNVLCAIILAGGRSNTSAGLGHGHAHDHSHGHAHGHSHGRSTNGRDGEDHNLRSAYLHVLADALTSIAAIVALLVGKYFGMIWFDPLMGVVGALLVGRWSIGLSRDTARVLLDYQAPHDIREEIRSALERETDDRVTDLHVWSIGPGLHAAEIAIVSHHPAPPEHYKSLLPKGARIAHTTVEVHHCQEH